ncbi:alpha/beta fold hydrolase, partial [Gemmatimonadota bacterium]
TVSSCSGSTIGVVCVVLAASLGWVGCSDAGEGTLLEINGTELFVQRMGQGEPILVLHGGPVLEHGYLLPHLAPLAEDHELIFFDQRLCGRSAGIVDPSSVRLDTFVEDIEGIREALGLGRIHLLAHSWGGLLGMQYALAHGENLRSLILLSPMSASERLWQEEEAAQAAKISLADRMARIDIMGSEAFEEERPEAIRELLLLTFQWQFHDPAKIEGLELFVPEDYGDRSRQFGLLRDDLAGYDFHEELRSVTAPALILYGADEPGAEIGGRALQEKLPNSEFVVMEDAGHFPFIEQPEPFLEIVRAFLGSLGDGLSMEESASRLQVGL